MKIHLTLLLTLQISRTHAFDPDTFNNWAYTIVCDRYLSPATYEDVERIFKLNSSSVPEIKHTLQTCRGWRSIAVTTEGVFALMERLRDEKNEWTLGPIFKKCRRMRSSAHQVFAPQNPTDMDRHLYIERVLDYGDGKTLVGFKIRFTPVVGEWYQYTVEYSKKDGLKLLEEDQTVGGC
ncbi:unnamed protein product [Caenorhabditis angaria]|uniref:DUF38 domain-containing protein n=1 Tax=Caenorhabditis angaria TaxID=860376 RepID=A0A9P1N0X9_9PELO|nr:unnamed protein product [Caenorhabditis angaria]